MYHSSIIILYYTDMNMTFQKDMMHENYSVLSMLH